MKVGGLQIDASSASADPVLGSPSLEQDKPGFGTIDRMYHVYAVVDIAVHDVASLGSVEIVVSEYPLEPPANKAAILVCVAQAGHSWFCDVEERLNNWLRSERMWCCCTRRQQHQLWRPGKAPPHRWMVQASTGEVWQRYSEQMVTHMVMKEPKEAAQSLLGDISDPVEAYHRLLLESGRTIPIPMPKSKTERACYAKYLHMLESSEVDKLTDILLQACSGSESLDFPRELIAGKVEGSCSVM